MTLNIKHFIDLPIDIIISILTIWLDMIDLCKLDTAINNKKQILFLLNILKSKCQYLMDVHFLKFLNINKTYLKWVAQRQNIY
jgi:hypothetical protein